MKNCGRVLKHFSFYHFISADAFGGWTDADGFCAPLKTAEAYDPSGDSWVQLPDMIVGRGDKASGRLNGRVFAIGGESKSGGCSGLSGPVLDVEVFDVESGAWSTVGAIPEEKFRFASATSGSTIFVFGGQAPAIFCSALNTTCNPVTNHTLGLIEEVQHNKKRSSGLTTGAIAGIVVASCVVAFAAAVGLVWYFKAPSGEGIVSQGNFEKHAKLTEENENL